MRGADFANLLGHLMNPEGRQDLAAAGLQSVSIGPQIEVITVAEPLPDAASLLAFARGQGLDDATLKALFGSAAAESAAAGMLAEASTPAALGLTAQATLTAALTTGAAAQAVSPSAAETPVLVTAAALEAARPVYLMTPGVSALTLQTQAADASTAETGEAAQLRPAWSLPVPAQADALGQAVAEGSAALASAQASDLSPLTADSRWVPALAVAPVMVPPSTVTVAPVAPHVAVAPGLVGASAQGAAVTSVADEVTPVLGAPAPAVPAGTPPATPLDARVSDLRWQMSAQGGSLAAEEAQAVSAQADLSDQGQLEALRLRLAPQEAITRRLAAMSGSGEQTAWAQVSGQAAATAVLRLDLRESGLKTAVLNPAGSVGADAPVTEMDGQATWTASHSAPEAARTHAAASAPAAWSSTAAQRADYYEQLAQRLGEALGQRLQSQLERGQWKMQMRLDPASLGRIDLELDMSAGGLDAVFRSDNQLTRDLIAQGLPRLRESLNQSGTAVANVWVQGDSSRQSGGNPTPWRAPEPSGQAAGHEEDSREPIVQATDHRTRQGTSAWDVLA
jgi:flagellar hook-length control protein FliK